jgi:hypothetical protein
MFTHLLLANLLIAFPPALNPDELSKQPGVAGEAAAGLPSGKWRVDYNNGVTEVCVVNKEGGAVVTEPVRIVGRAAVSGNAILFLFENGRAQRWTAIGNRFVVEHWCPGEKFPTTSASTLGIAEPVQ